MKQILYIGLGGAAGSILRYLIYKWMYDFTPSSFPIGTFAVNTLGCFLIGLLYGLTISQQWLTADLRLLLMTGFCGGFTTFSAFSLEGYTLLQQQRFITFFVYFAASMCVGLAVTFAGAWLTK